MYSRAISQRVRHRRRAGLIALAAIFWLAQLQGVSHLASHLSRDHAAPHALLCGDCIASADAGAAPLSSLPLPALIATTDALAAPAGVDRPAHAPATAYRSRAPPVTPS